MRSAPPVSATTARVILDELERRGVDADPLLRRHSIHRSTLSNPLGRLPRETILAFVRDANEVSGDPMLHVAATDSSAIGAFGLADYIGSMGPTVGDGFQRILRLFHLVNPWMAFDITESGDVVTVQTRPVMILMSDPIETECTLVALARRVRQITGGAGRPREVRFAHEHPTTVRRSLEAYWACPVSLGAGHNAIDFERRTWEAPSVLRDETLGEVLWSVARSIAAEYRLTGGFDRLGRAVAEGIAAGGASIESVAERLGTSVRSLQRQLGNLGTTYSEVLDSVRRRIAIDALRRGRESVTEIALNLGFSETSAFSRAFRRWTGRPPSAYIPDGSNEAPE